MAKIKNASIIFFVFIYSLVGIAQNELNPFKYIIVPKQFDFLKKENQYRLNSMTKYLFEQEGFIAIYQGDEYPADLHANPCLAATALVLNESSVLTTKLVVSLQDCRDKEIYRTAEGKSKIKEFDKTYVDALKKSFVSIQNLNYSFDESLVVNAGANTMVVNQPSNEIVNSSVMSQTEEKTIGQNADPVSVENKDTAAEVGTVAAVPVLVNKNTAAEANPGTVAAVPVLVNEKPEEEPVLEVSEENIVVNEEKIETSELSGGARAFKNENTTFLLVDQGSQMQAFVSESKNKNYKPGELIGTFKKTSLPNVFRVSWKKPLEGVESTTAYFDDKGNLKIDIERNDTIEVLSFSEIK